MSENYANYAFISYSHKDEKWAAWIQRKLESYRLPSIIRKEAGSTVPERIRPVFRDATDLGAGRLRNNLQQELEASRFLVVVCSPNSARPNEEGKHWVDHEVSHFASLGRTDRIVPVIVEGDDKTAFGPKLKELGILAIDATKKSRARVLNDIVAKLLGLRPDELWRREERLSRRKRAWRALAAAVALLVAAAGAWRWYDLYVTHVEYYSDWVDEWGIPTGIPDARLTKDQVRNRLFSYRFEYRGRKKGGFFAPRVLRCVTMVDASDRPYDENLFYFLEDEYYTDRPIIQHLWYLEEDGTLQRIDDHDKDGNLLVRHKFSGDRKTDVEHVRTVRGEEANSAIIADPSDGNLFGSPDDGSKRTEIRRYYHERDENGRIAKTFFRKGRSEEARDPDGAYGVSFERDADGRPVRETFFGKNDEPHVTRAGILGTKRQFSDSGFLVRSVWIDKNDRPVRNASNGCFAEATCSRDAFGNLVRVDYLDAEGRPTLDESGIASSVLTMDRGSLRRFANLDADNRPSRSSLGFAAIDFERSADGAVSTLRFLDENERPCPAMFGAAAVRRTYRNGDLVRVEWLDEEGEPMLGEDGAAVWEFEWENHKETKRLFLGLDGQPVHNSDGVYGTAFRYDKDGFKTKFSYLGPDGEPMTGPEGWASWSRKYDQDGQPVTVRFTDAQDMLICNREGVAGWNSKFKGGNETERAFVGEDGKPTLSSDGIAGVSYSYENGHLVSFRYFGIEHEPVRHKDGSAGGRYDYDDEGHRVGYDRLGIDGKALMDAQIRAAGWRAAYDEFGNEIEHRWLGADGKTCFTVEGWAGWKARYDEWGRMTNQIALGTNGLPVRIPKDGAYGYHWSYDDIGNRTTETFLGKDGEPAACSMGYVTERQEYDERGNNIRDSYLDRDGRLVSPNHCSGIAGSSYEYDRFGNMTRNTFFGTDGKPAVFAYLGYATKEDRFDEAGHDAGTRYYDENGYLTLDCDMVVAGWDLENDGRGNVLRKTWIGTDGKPCRTAEGNAGWRAKYDRRNNLTERVFVDENGNPVATKNDGIAGFWAEYDVNGRIVRYSNLGMDERPIKNAEGWAAWTKLFDSRGEEIEQKFFDEKGNPCPIPGKGWCGWTKTVDGNARTTTYLGPDGMPAPTKNGWSAIRIVEDDVGNHLSQSFLDSSGKPFPDNDGRCTILMSYDEKGRITKQSFHDENGSLVPARPWFVCGYADDYFDDGSIHRFRYIGADGKDGVRLDGVAAIVSHQDAYERVSEQAFLNKEDRFVIAPSEGFAIKRFHYDYDHNETTTLYLDASTNLILNADGVAAETSKKDYSKKNLLARETCRRYFGLDGKPCLEFSTGTAGWESHYDTGGNEDRRTWLGTEVSGTSSRTQAHAAHRDGYVSWMAEYDEQCRKRRQRFLDGNRNPVETRNGIAGFAWDYDRAGNVIRQINLDKVGNPTEDNGGWAIEETDYDTFNRPIEVRWLGMEGEPVLEIFTGCAGYRNSLDIYGNVTNRVYFGLDGKPKATDLGNAGFTRTYERGLCMSAWNIGIDGNPIDIVEGYSGRECRYDEFGRMIEQWYLDSDGQPCSDTNGCARMRWVYDERGLCTECEELDLNGNLFTNAVHAATKTVYEYDERGHETIRRFVDADGKLRANPRGFAARAVVCDFAGRETEVRYLDEEEKPVRNLENGVAIERREWDGRGNLVVIRYFDETDAPCVCSNSYASVKTTFDIRGFATKTLHYGTDGALIALPESGCAGWTSDRDRLGNEAKHEWIGTDGKPSADKNGVYGWTSEFARGKETSRRWIAADGSPCRAADGTLGWDKTYDEYGTELSKNDVR